jgi:dihydroorotase
VTVLKQAVLDGTIDCVASHHLPHEYDSKVVEFEYAKAGMTGLDIAYAVLRTAIPELSVERTVSLLSSSPRDIFGIEQPAITEGKTACLSLFDPSGTTSVEEGMLRSKSKNTAFLGQTLKGRALGIINGERVVWSERSHQS